jgi:S-formylglutathione hydrolase FrmB
MIVAMPDGGPTGIPSDWWDFGLPGAPDYEKFQVQEVLGLLRRDYRANGAAAVARVSTGGYGALAHAARQPGSFAAAASYSGVLDTTLLGVAGIVWLIVAREKQLPINLWGDPILQAVNWSAHNPRSRAEGLRGTRLYVSAGSGLSGGVSADQLLPQYLESAVRPSTDSFVQELQRLGIPATSHLYSGGTHSWTYWQTEFRTSWPLLAAGLGLSTF